MLTMQSAIYVAISSYLVSCLVAPTSLCGARENIFKKRYLLERNFPFLKDIFYNMVAFLTAMNSACRMICECVIFAGQGLSAVFYCSWKWSLEQVHMCYE